MSAIPELNNLSRAFQLEDVVIKDMKQATHDAVLSKIFFQATCFSVGSALCSLELYGKIGNITLLFGATAMLSALASSYFSTKAQAGAKIADMLNHEVELLKKKAAGA